MRDAWFPAEKVAKQSLQTLGVGLGRRGLALVGRIVVQAHDGLAVWTFAPSIEGPLPSIRIDKVGEAL